MKKKTDWTTILIVLVVLIALGNLIHGRYESQKESETVIEEKSTFDPYRMSRFDDLSEHIVAVTENVRESKPEAILTEVRWNEEASRYELYFETNTSNSVEYIQVR